MFGDVPSIEALRFQGNESFLESNLGYNSMGLSEFIADRAFEIQVRHYFDGFLFNKVPLLQRLHWREVLGFNFILSKMQNSQSISLADIDYSLMNPQKPYMEFYYGIDNIFTFLRVSAFHRLTYLGSPSCPSLFGMQGFGLKISINVSL
jgi:hypothetical protein